MDINSSQDIPEINWGKIIHLGTVVIIAVSENGVPITNFYDISTIDTIPKQEHSLLDADEQKFFNRRNANSSSSAEFVKVIREHAFFQFGELPEKFGEIATTVVKVLGSGNYLFDLCENLSHPEIVSNLYIEMLLDSIVSLKTPLYLHSFFL